MSLLKHNLAAAPVHRRPAAGSPAPADAGTASHAMPGSGLGSGWVYLGLLGGLLALLLVTGPGVVSPSVRVQAFVLETLCVVLALWTALFREWPAPRAREALLAPVNLAILGFLLWVGLQTLRADLPSFARYELMRHVSGALLYFALVYGAHARLAGRLMVLVCGVAALGAGWSLATEARGDAFRPHGPFGESQLFAAVLGVLIPVLAASARAQETQLRRGVALAATVTCGIALLATLGRSGWLGAAAGLLFLGAFAAWLMLRHQSSMEPSRVLIPALTVLGALSVFVVLSPQGNRFGQRLLAPQGLTQDATLGWRQDLWTSAGSLVSARPLTGWGPGSFPVNQARFTPGSRTELEILTEGISLSENAHNTYMQMAAEIGIPGLALYLLIFAGYLAVALRTLYHHHHGPRIWLLTGCTGGVVAYLVSALGSPAWEYLQCSTCLWLTLGLGMMSAGLGKRGLVDPADLAEDFRGRQRRRRRTRSREETDVHV